jgi:hypothetical protein
MTIDTLAYTKALEAAGVDHNAAALARYVLPELVTKGDLDIGFERLEHRLTFRFFGMLLGVVGLMDAILFALLRFGH